MGKSRATGVMCLASETNEPRQPKQHLSTSHLLSAQYDPWCYVTDRKMFMGQRLTWRKTGFSTFILQLQCNYNSLQLFLHASEYFSIHFFAVPRKNSPFTLAWLCRKIFCELCVIPIFSDSRIQVRRNIAQSIFSTKLVSQVDLSEWWMKRQQWTEVGPPLWLSASLVLYPKVAII